MKLQKKKQERRKTKLQEENESQKKDGRTNLEGPRNA